MSESSAQISYRVQQLGAEGVRARLREINNELKAGRPVTKALNSEVKELSRQVNTQDRVVRLSSQAWLENHRTLQSAQRAMSAVSGVARTALAITTAWSVAALAFGKTNSSLMEARLELERLQAQLATGTGMTEEEKSKLQDEINVLQTRIKEFETEEFQGKITTVINTIASLSLGFGGAVTAAAKLGPMLHGLKAAFIGVGVSGGVAAGGTTAATGAIRFMPAAAAAATFSLRGLAMAFRGLFIAMGPVGWALLAMSIVIPLVIEHWDEIVSFFQDVVAPALKAFADFLVGLFLGWAASTIKAIKDVIDWFAKLLGIQGQATGGSVKNNAGSEERKAAKFFAGASPKVNKRAGGGLITEPVVGMGINSGELWTFGENGRQEIVTPLGGRAGGGNTVIVNVYGDVSGEELIHKVKKSLKEGLIDRGFTGF